MVAQYTEINTFTKQGLLYRKESQTELLNTAIDRLYRDF
jgi:hypothetical protein